MSAAAVLGIVLIIGFVGVALVACIAWRNRMRESMPYSDWHQAAQEHAAQSSEWNKDSQAAARLAVNVKEVLLIRKVVLGARGPPTDTTVNPERS